MRSTAVLFALCLATAPATAARAQMTLPDDSSAPPDGATLFLNQCGTCHTVEHGAAPRQGPNLAGVVGRRAGSLPGFAYSQGFAKADWTWDGAHLDRWLTNPQAMIPSAVMLYRQADDSVRKTIIDWLKDQH
jgi:cytochrome c